MADVPPPLALPLRAPSTGGRGRGRGATPDVKVIQTGRSPAPGLALADARRADIAMSTYSTASSVAPPSPAGSRAPSVSGSASGDPASRAQEKEVRTQEKELRKEPLPLGWKVYVSRSTGRPYWHHKDSNETRWTKPGIGPNDDANASTQKLEGLLQSLDDKLNSNSPPMMLEDERKKEDARLKHEDEQRKQEEDEKRKAAYMKKAEDAKNELDIFNLVAAAATKEKEFKDDSVAKQPMQSTQVQKNRLLSLSKSAAEKDATQISKEGRWWDQVEKDARDIAAGEMQPGADSSAFPVLSNMGKTVASMTISTATSRAESVMCGDAPSTPLDERGRPCGPKVIEIGGADVATPLSIGLAGLRSPSVERRMEVAGGWDGSGGAKLHEEAGDLGTAETMYLASGDDGVAMAADMYIRHKMIEEAVRVTRASASGRLEAEGLVYELIQKAVKSEHNTEKAAQMLEQYCGGEHAVRLALERGVFAVALGVATRNHSAMHMVPEIRFAHGDAMIRAGKFDEASDLFVRANRHLAAAQLHGLLGQWDKAAAVANRHKGGQARAWVESSRDHAGPLSADRISGESAGLSWESQGLTTLQVGAVRNLVASPPKAPKQQALEAGWPENTALSVDAGVPVQATSTHVPCVDEMHEMHENSPVTNDPYIDGKFISLLPSSGAPSARSSSDLSAFDNRSMSGEVSVRPSTAKRELELILKSKLDVHNIHVSADAAQAGWGGASARSGSEGSVFNDAGPGSVAGSAKGHLQKLLNQGLDDDDGTSRGDTDQPCEFDDLKDKVKAYKQRKRAAPELMEEAADDNSILSARTDEEGAGMIKSEYDKTIDSCLSVMMGPTKTPDYLEDLWLRAATIAMDHVPRRKAEVVTEVTDRLIKLGRQRTAAELCLNAGYHKEALQMAIRSGLWDIGDRVVAVRPDLSNELAFARSMATDDIEENLVPFAEYVRKGREKRHRPLPLTTRIAHGMCYCCGCSTADADDDDLDTVLQQERAAAQAGRPQSCCRCFGKKQDAGQTAKSKGWGAGLDDNGLPLPPSGLLAKVCFPCALAFGQIAPCYSAVREKLVRLRNIYPLLAIAQALAMVVLSRDDLYTCTFDTRSQTSTSFDGRQSRVIVPESNWILPLLLARQLVGVVAIFAMWVCWERQRYYRQLVSSPLLMQVGMLLIAVGNGALFAHLRYALRWKYVVAHDTFDCIYYTCHSAGIAVLCFGLKRSWWDLISLIIVPATALVYLRASYDLRWVAYILQAPLAALLAIKLFRCFQDVRLLLVPAFLVLMHLGLSCLMLFVPSVLMVVLRDMLADVVGCMLLCLCIWVIPSTIEWVEDEELADLQGVGDAETLREQLDKVREKHRVPKGFETLYEVNRARQDAGRLKELMTGQNPDMYAELNRMYSPDAQSFSRSALGAGSVQSHTSNTEASLSLEQRRADLSALRNSVLNPQHHTQAFDYTNSGAAPMRPNSQFSDAPGKTMAQMDPRRSRDLSRSGSVASAASVQIDVSGVSHLWRSPGTPRISGASPSHTPDARDRSYEHSIQMSMASEASGMTHVRSASRAPPPPSAPPTARGAGASPAAPRAVPDGFAIQLDKLPQEGRKFVLKENVRQGAALAPPSPIHSLGPAEEAMQTSDSALKGGRQSVRNGRPSKTSTLALGNPPNAPVETQLDSAERSSSRATPNGRPKKLPSSGLGNPPAPGTPRGGPPLSSAGWGSLLKSQYDDSRASSRASSDDDAMSIASVSSVSFPSIVPLSAPCSCHPRSLGSARTHED